MPKPLTDVVREWPHDTCEHVDCGFAGPHTTCGHLAPTCRLCAVKQWMQDILRAPECSVADALGVEDGDE